jgi:hypothetical protein
MPASLATVAALLKEIYEPNVRKQLNDDVVALRRVERSSDGIETTVGGRYVTFAIRTRRNSGIGARNELEALPTPGQQGNAAARVGLKYLYGGVRLSGQTFELADKNFQAFTSVLEQEMDGLKTDLAKDCNRQVYGDGSGAVVVCTTAGTTVNTFTSTNVMYAQLGMQIDVIDGTTLAAATPTVKISNRQITGINTTTGVITFDGAAGSSAVGDIIVRTGNVNREWTGFAKIVSNTGTLYNIDPNVEPVWKAEVMSNSGTLRALSEGLMVNMADNIRTNGGKTTVIFSDLGVRRAYWNLLVQQRQYVNTKEFAGGFTGLAFTTDAGEIPFVADVDCPRNRQYFLNEKELTYYREGDWSWMNRDGSMWQRVIGYDAYDGVMYQYSELGCHRRNTQGVILDLTEA